MAAFERLYQRHAGKVFGYLLRRLSDRNVAKDLFQTAFLKLHKARRRYDSTYPFLPWLFTITRRALIDHYRKQGAEPKSVEISPEIAAAESPPVSLPSLVGLTGDQREAIRLRFGNDLPFDEIAQKLKTSPVNVRQILSRAVRKLRGRT